MNEVLPSCGRTSFIKEILKCIIQKKYIAKCEYVPFVNQDGVKIDGWVLKPKDYSSKKHKKYRENKKKIYSQVNKEEIITLK